MRRKLRAALLVLTPPAALTVALAAVDLPLYSLAPGPARSVAPRIEVDGPRTYESRGRLLLTTVDVGHLTVFGVFGAWRDPAVDVVPEREILTGGESEREHDAESRSDMDESKIAAVVYALERLTGYPEEHGNGVLVHTVLDGTPAAGRLFSGDLILEVDGRPVDEVDEVGRAIDAAGTRRPLRLLVEAGEERRAVDVLPARGEDGPYVGVVLVESFPFEVRIASGDVGGPSAGLMWALGVFDLLTPGDLTAGRTVAGTGAIDLDGGVHPVGGVGHKVLAAERAGADLFLLPRANLEEARRAGAAVELAPVETVDQALRLLEGAA